MRLLNSTLVTAAFLFFAATAASAHSPDPGLLHLVPPGSQIVAGMRAPSPHGQPSSFLLITHNNTVDLNDFFALTGADELRRIDQVIFVAAANRDGKLGEHSLLISGHFDPTRIFQSTDRLRPTTGQYHGIAVLAVQPFERERPTFSDLRWLALIGSDVAVFGTVASVQQELDRHLAHSEPDPNITERLTGLRRDSDTWCVVDAPLPHGEIQSVLSVLDPQLAAALTNGGSFVFGIRYSKQVEFEYQITTPSNIAAQIISGSLTQQLSGPQAKASSLVPHSGISSVGQTLHGVMRLSRSRYEEWITEISTRSSP
jgi:hypothetical protein